MAAAAWRPALVSRRLTERPRRLLRRGLECGRLRLPEAERGQGRARGVGGGRAGRERPAAPAPWRTVGPLASEAAFSERLLGAQPRLFLTIAAGRRPRMVPFYREGHRAKLRKMPRVTLG